MFVLEVFELASKINPTDRLGYGRIGLGQATSLSILKLSKEIRKALRSYKIHVGSGVDPQTSLYDYKHLLVTCFCPPV